MKFEHKLVISKFGCSGRIKENKEIYNKYYKDKFSSISEFIYCYLHQDTFEKDSVCPVCGNKINFDNKEENYFKITNFTTSRLYLLLLLPLFVNIYTNWYMFNDILSHQSLAYFSVYLVTNAVVNIFVIKYTLNKKRNSDLDQNINVIIYIIILGLLLLAR